MTNFNEGDKVYVVGGGWSRVLQRSKVIRVTKTQAILATGGRYNRVTGRMVGGNEWSASRIEQPSPSLDATYRKQQVREAAARLANVARDYSIERDVPPEDIRAAFAAWDEIERMGGEG